MRRGLTFAAAALIVAMGSVEASARNGGGPAPGGGGPPMGAAPPHGGGGNTGGMGNVSQGSRPGAFKPANPGVGASKNFDRGPKIGWNGPGRGHGHNNRGRYVVGVPYYYDDYSYSYGSDSDCGWLYRKAQRTGSPYWWRRYQQCVE